jgi:hypothetical protein
MAAVYLEFLPPAEENISELHVEEAPAVDGPFSEVQSFPAGAYPNYIRSVDVTNATNPLDWFRVRWEDAAGNFTDYSSPIKGGTTTIVAQVADRVILRDSSVNPLIAGQEAEAAVQEYFGVADPYTIDPAEGTPKVLSGLTLLTLARAYTLRLIQRAETGQKWAAGLVSMDSGTASNQSWSAIDKMIELANRELGRNYSRVLLMNELSVAGGLRQLKSYDVSRAIIELA